MKRTPTPTARDWKDTPGSAAYGVNPDGSVRDRTDRLAIWVYEQERRAGNENVGHLHPDYSESVMWWPIGWSSEQPLTLDWDRWLSSPQEVSERVGFDLENRSSRLKAIGNGQVPQVAELAWRLLSEQ